MNFRRKHLDARSFDHVEYARFLAREKKRSRWSLVLISLFWVAVGAGIVVALARCGEAPTYSLSATIIVLPPIIDAGPSPYAISCGPDFTRDEVCCLYTDYSYRCSEDDR